MKIQKPIWCKCKKVSWTRRQLLIAFENQSSQTCAECRREITPSAIGRLLTKLGLINPSETDYLDSR